MFHAEQQTYRANSRFSQRCERDIKKRERAREREKKKKESKQNQSVAVWSI
jgi:hypothetical protein